MTFLVFCHGTVRLGASEFSVCVCVRIAGVTQTLSPENASRHTNPSLHVSGPYCNNLREAAAALSAAVCERTAPVTQT